MKTRPSLETGGYKVITAAALPMFSVVDAEDIISGAYLIQHSDTNIKEYPVTVIISNIVKICAIQLNRL